MIKTLLSISVVCSSLFTGICNADISHASNLEIDALIEHEHEIECDHCEAINEQEVNCCGGHLDGTENLAILQPTKPKISEHQQFKALLHVSEISEPLHLENTVQTLSENKAPPYLQMSLPKRE